MKDRLKRHFLLIGVLATSTSLLAVDAQEEALILNQELEFLEQSTRSMPVNTLQGARVNPSPSRRQTTDDLEIIYFGDGREDAVRTRTAAPRRRKTSF